MKPIIMSTEDVRAVLDGRKTMFRQVMKPQPVRNGAFWEIGGAGWSGSTVTPVYGHSLYNRMPYKPGDVLWVRETFAEIRNIETGHVDTFYASNKKDSDTVNSTHLCDDDGFVTDRHIPWKPSIHMPREAARLFLRAKGVRVERVQDISPEDCESEGYFETAPVEPRPRSWFSAVWDARNAKRGYGWDSNPFVWVISFERLE